MNNQEEVEAIDFSEKFDNPRMIKFLLKLSYIDEKERYCISDLERYLFSKTCQPDIRRLIEFLIEKRIFTKVSKQFNITMYKINIKKLTDYIDELNVASEWYDYFNTHHYCIW
jgi:hypothetical protein